MKRMNCFSIGLVLVMSTLALPGGAQNGSTTSQNQATAQGQTTSGSSLGDYARQVRKDSGSASKSRPKVFDNDNLPREDKLSVIGEEPPVSGTDNSAPAKAAEPSANAPASEAKPGEASQAKPEPKNNDMAAKQAAWKQWQERLGKQREQIELLQRELDVMQREYQIRAAAFYADAGNRLRNSGEWDKTDAQYKQQVADKTKAVEDAKQKLDDMEEEARKAGVPANMREP
jgi:hypothetical protein